MEGILHSNLKGNSLHGGTRLDEQGGCQPHSLLDEILVGADSQEATEKPADTGGIHPEGCGNLAKSFPSSGLGVHQSSAFFEVAPSPEGIPFRGGAGLFADFFDNGRGQMGADAPGVASGGPAFPDEQFGQLADFAQLDSPAAGSVD